MHYVNENMWLSAFDESIVSYTLHTRTLMLLHIQPNWRSEVMRLVIECRPSNNATIAAGLLSKPGAILHTVLRCSYYALERRRRIAQCPMRVCSGLLLLYARNVQSEAIVR